MKKFESTRELIIICLAFILIVLPEICYSCLLEVRDWINDV